MNIVRRSRLVAMVQHPRCLFAYWDLDERLGRLPLALRLHELGSAKVEVIPVGTPAGTHYFYPVTPGRLYCLELGARAAKGGFHGILRSNVVEMPAAPPPDGCRGDAGERWSAYSPLGGMVTVDA